MLRITNAVKEILFEDDIAMSSLKKGILNFSAYSREIKEKVEIETKKPVNEKTLVVVLSRIAKEITREKQVIDLKILSLSVHSNLTEVTYERTKQNIERVGDLYKSITLDLQSFFTITQSSSEITITGTDSLIEDIEKAFYDTEQLYHQKDLVGVTVKIPLEYLKIPNVIYRISKRLAIKKINIIEIVSTSTELTFIIDKNDTGVVIQQLGKFL